MTSLTVIVHVGAGSLWLIATLAIAWIGRLTRWLALVQMASAIIAIIAGIDLWHARHAGAQGPAEHLLTVGSFCALIALGLQVPIAIPGLLRGANTRLAAGPLWLARGGALMLACAATAMAGSLAA